METRRAGADNRPRGLLEALHEARPFSRDPMLVVLAFSVWSALSGLSLLWPGDIFAVGPQYRALARLDIPEEVWGAAMMADAVLLARTTLLGSLVARAAAASVSGAFWLYFGAYVLAGGFEAGVLSAVGCWEVAAGLGLLAATVQWAGYNDGRGTGEGPDAS